MEKIHQKHGDSYCVRPKPNWATLKVCTFRMRWVCFFFCSAVSYCSWGGLRNMYYTMWKEAKIKQYALLWIVNGMHGYIEGEEEFQEKGVQRTQTTSILYQTVRKYMYIMYTLYIYTFCFFFHCICMGFRYSGGTHTPKKKSVYKTWELSRLFAEKTSCTLGPSSRNFECIQILTCTHIMLFYISTRTRIIHTWVLICSICIYVYAC